MAKILIVEDDALIARTLQNRLIEARYEVVGHEMTGEGALREAEAQCPDLVLMDVGLRGSLDGVATALELRKRFNIPTVFLTAHDDPDTLERAKVSRPLGYLIKPYAKEDLYRTMDLAIYNHQVEMALQKRESEYRYLSDATQILLSSLSPNVVLQKLTEFALPRLADFCLFEALSEDGLFLYRVAGSHVKIESQRHLDLKATRVPKQGFETYPAWRALAQGRPIQEGGPHPDHSLLADLQATTFICVPLIAEGKKLGALTLGHSVSKRCHTESDLEISVELAHRAALALQHAQLYQQSLSHIEELKLSEEVVLRLNRTLEARVQERTEELLKANELISNSLKEKETLLKEIHHRVKNNMQIISSLLRLQTQHSTSEDVQKIIGESQSRIRSMAIVHEMLYLANDFNQINFKHYLEKLARQLLANYNGDDRQLKFTLDSDEVPVSLDDAIPCGLIATELVSNALKHAFPADRSGTIHIRFRQPINGLATLVIEDDGIGISPRKTDSDTASVGWTIVSALCRQMGGTLRTQTLHHGGVQFAFSFPMKQAASAR